MTVTDPNKKGALGEFAVCKDLMLKGFEVFKECGGSSKVDLVALDDNYTPYKIQVKTVTPVNNVVTIPCRKTCLDPRYNSRYTVNQIDVFAIYVLDDDRVFYITASEFLQNRNSVSVRLILPKNGQRKGIRLIEDYLGWPTIFTPVV